MPNRKLVVLLVVVSVVAFLLGVALSILWQKRTSIGGELLENTEEMANDFALDAEYENSYLSTKSNYEKCEVNSQFTEKWKHEADYYLGELLNMADETLEQALTAEQEAWEASYQILVDGNLAYLQYVYGAGTIVPILHSRYEYDLQRERAIELCKMYNNVKIVWDVINKTGDGSKPLKK